MTVSRQPSADCTYRCPMGASQWRDLIVVVIHRSYEPGRRFALQNLYQRVKGSPEFMDRPAIADPEATIRNVINGLVRDGTLERLGGGDYRYR